MTFSRMGQVGVMAFNTSAEPDFDVCARLPCFAISSSGEAMMLAVVLMLKVEWLSPPVPTMSHNPPR